MRSTPVYALIFSLYLLFGLVSTASVHQQRYLQAARGQTTARTTTKVTITTTKKAATVKTTTTSKAAPTSPAGSGSTSFSGDGTWFDIGLGSCGQTNTDTDFVAALNAPQMMNGANPNANPMCGKQIKITNPANGKSVTVKIVDTCPPCASGSVDLSPAAFGAIADLSAGRIKINWVFV
ncbi:hypothetical protein INT47_002066 [Mucor saturninus]|uniref:RlpA-like protein double-psi beta-barrel domain-containing protein n=1 Tax=Mucor saturninus TaxID=64648 RepID=A0A8H7R180_9FUNG|nr:hypothetical protein INT47_002066 [Mucor saturninus]